MVPTATCRLLFVLVSFAKIVSALTGEKSAEALMGALDIVGLR